MALCWLVSTCVLWWNCSRTIEDPEKLQASRRSGVKGGRKVYSSSFPPFPFYYPPFAPPWASAQNLSHKERCTSREPKHLKGSLRKSRTVYFTWQGEKLSWHFWNINSSSSGKTLTYLLVDHSAMRLQTFAQSSADNAEAGLQTFLTFESLECSWMFCASSPGPANQRLRCHKGTTL